MFFFTPPSQKYSNRNHRIQYGCPFGNWLQMLNCISQCTNFKFCWEGGSTSQTLPKCSPQLRKLGIGVKIVITNYLTIQISQYGVQTLSTTEMGGEHTPTRPQCQLRGSHVLLSLASSALENMAASSLTLGWNCTRCTLQSSSPQPRKLGFGELDCKVHLVQFQLMFTYVHSHVLCSSQARSREHENEHRWTWGRVGDVLPPSR